MRSVRDLSINGRTIISFCVLFLPLLAVVIIASSTVHLLQFRAEEKLVEKNETIIIDFQATLISNQLNTALEDIRDLSEDIRGGAVYRSAENNEDDPDETCTIHDELTLFLKRKTRYSRATLFDATGDRICGLSFDAGKVSETVVSADDSEQVLQHARSLDPETIYVSRMELAKQGHPIVRLVSPIETAGVGRLYLELEYDLRPLTNMIRNASNIATGDIMLLNAAGYWLLSPRRDDEWGFLDQRTIGRTFAAAEPRVWEAMIRSDNGLFHVDDGIYVYRAVYPIMNPHELLPFTDRRIEFDQGMYGGMIRDRLHWYLVSFVPDSYVGRSLESFRRRLVVLSVFVVMILAAVSLLASLTRRRRLLAEAKVEEEASIFTNNPAPVLRLDADGEILKLNPAAAKVLETAAAEGGGAELFTNLDYTLVQRLSENTQFQFEQRIGKRHFLFSVKKRPGERTCLLYGSDITGLKDIEREIRKLSAAVEQSATAILITDLSGSITFVNEACARSSGYTVDELIGQNTRIFRSGHQPSEVYENLWSTIAAGKVWHGSLRNRKKTGEYYWEDVTITPVRSDRGELNGYLAVKEDITHRMAFEEELRKAKEDAEAANRLKSEFLANMSHEIRTPLNAVIGFTDVLLDSEEKPDRRRNLEIIRRSGKHLLTLIQDILDFSKIEADKVVIQPAAFAIRNVIDHLTGLLDESIREKNLRFDVHIAQSIPPVLSGDEHRITQILINVMSNAIKFTETGGIDLRCTYIDGILILEVSDTGIGIASDKLETIFSAFEQASSTTERMYGGTGLGLAISRRLSEMMGGSISAASVLGEGSTFTIRLPLPSADVELPALVEEVDESPADTDFVDGWFRAMGNDPLLHGVLRKGIRDLPAKLEKIEAAYQAADAESLLKIAHDLKGYTGNLGMHEVYEIARGLHDGLHYSRLTREECGVYIERLRDTIGSIPDHYFRTEEELQADREAESVEGRRLCVLTAEDNEANRELYRVLLGELGIESHFAENGREVLDALEHNEYDVLLLDMWMPVMDGFETLQAIRANPGWDDLHIIAVTAHAMEGDADKYRSQGCDDYLAKPIDRKLFRAKIERLRESLPERSI